MEKHIIFTFDCLVRMSDDTFVLVGPSPTDLRHSAVERLSKGVASAEDRRMLEMLPCLEEADVNYAPIMIA